MTWRSRWGLREIRSLVNARLLPPLTDEERRRLGTPGGPRGRLNLRFLEGEDLSERTLRDASVRLSELHGVGFRSATLERCRFSASLMDEIVWSGARLVDCTFRGCTFWRGAAEGATFERCVFDGCRAHHWDLGGARFHDCDFHGLRGDSVRLSDVTLRACRFRACTIDGLGCYGATLQDVTFVDSTIASGVFSKFSGRGLTFARCALDGCGFNDATFEGLTFEGSTFDMSIRALRSDSLVIAGVRRPLTPRSPPPRVAFKDCELRGLTIRDCPRLEDTLFLRSTIADLNAANARLHETRIRESTFAGGGFERCALHGGVIKESRWTDVGLTRCGLHGAWLVRDTTFEGTRLQRCSRARLEVTEQGTTYVNSPRVFTPD